MQDKLETKVTAIYWPEERELRMGYDGQNGDAVAAAVV